MYHQCYLKKLKLFVFQETIFPVHYRYYFLNHHPNLSIKDHRFLLHFPIFFILRIFPQSYLFIQSNLHQMFRARSAIFLFEHR